VIDATCPFVTKVHLEVHRFLREGFQLILIGHRSHDEVDGTLGEAPGKIHLVESVERRGPFALPMTRVMILTQTTLSLDETRDVIAAIKKRFPNAQTPPKDDICYATQNRQDAVKDLLGRGINLLLVVGSKNSSNSQRLVDVARQSGCNAYLIDHAGEIDSRVDRPREICGGDRRGFGPRTFGSRRDHVPSVARRERWKKCWSATKIPIFHSRKN
jgi:4-hydroxy-3-methylbut-2-enyl diphosphate reductase